MVTVYDREVVVYSLRRGVVVAMRKGESDSFESANPLNV